MLSATTGRIATCSHSWMTAVVWVDGLAAKGLFAPARKHGPKWGPTTMQLAREIARLKECRPGIDYLMRKLKLSERTVQYHLGLLRDAGLLAYRSVGTRLGRGVRRASHFERIVPVAFDEAHGIRTLLRDESAPAYTRVPVGAAEEHRTLLGKLAKKAASKLRRRRPAKSRGGRARCTPMQVGTSAPKTDRLPHVPSEDKLASGNEESPTQKSPNYSPVNRPGRVPRRFQLAAELISQVPWLKRANRDRVAWIAQDVADCGWTALEVQAVAEDAGPLLPGDVRRPTGMLAHRLKGVTELYPTAAHRRTALKAWEDSQVQEHARHDGWDQVADARTPHSYRAQQALRTAFNRMNTPDTEAPGAFTLEAAPAPGVALEALDAEVVKSMRADAERDLSLITRALATGLSEHDARRLYTNRLVTRALTEEARNPALTPAF